jgi:multiple sugar transport system substrate-binding protein/lactose/L-arabinose transport system substrate-binding protein
MAGGDTLAVKRRKLLTGLAASSAVVVAGCINDDGSGVFGRDNDSGGDETGDSSGDDLGTSVKPTVWGWDNAADALETVGNFYQEKTEREVTVESFARTEMKEEFLSMVESGSGYPDTAMMESIDGPSWIDTGELRDVSDWIERDGLRSTFVSGKWEALTDEGGTYALPWDIGPVGTFYRRDLFEQYGIDPDSIETWDDFLAAGEAIATVDGQYLTNLPPNDYDGFWRAQFRQLGGEPFTEDGAVNIDSKVSLRVAENMHRLMESELVGSFESFGDNWNTALDDGTLVSLTAGSWMEGFLPETESGWGVMKPPAYDPGGSRATNWGGSNLVIPAELDEERAQAVWEFITFALATEEMQAQMLRDFGLFPAYEPALTSDAISIEKPSMGGQPTGELYAELAPDIEGYRFTTDTPAVSAAINRHFGLMSKGAKSPEQALEDAAQEVADKSGRERA